MGGTISKGNRIRKMAGFFLRLRRRKKFLEKEEKGADSGTMGYKDKKERES